MFKIVTVVVALVTATPVFAGGYHHGGGGYYHGGGGFHHGGGGGWVVPFVGGAIVGGVLGGALAYPYSNPSAPYYAAPYPYYMPTPTQPYYRWEPDAYGHWGWVWR
jgi:hypothetical protein